MKHIYFPPSFFFLFSSNFGFSSSVLTYPKIHDISVCHNPGDFFFFSPFFCLFLFWLLVCYSFFNWSTLSRITISVFRSLFSHFVSFSFFFYPCLYYALLCLQFVHSSAFFFQFNFRLFLPLHTSTIFLFIFLLLSSYLFIFLQSVISGIC